MHPHLSRYFIHSICSSAGKYVVQKALSARRESISTVCLKDRDGKKKLIIFVVFDKLWNHMCGGARINIVEKLYEHLWKLLKYIRLFTLLPVTQCACLDGRPGQLLATTTTYSWVLICLARNINVWAEQAPVLFSGSQRVGLWMCTF